MTARFNLVLLLAGALAGCAVAAADRHEPAVQGEANKQKTPLPRRAVPLRTAPISIATDGYVTEMVPGCNAFEPSGQSLRCRFTYLWYVSVILSVLPSVPLPLGLPCTGECG